jgi:aflatoxin B1 aldehyde reductase
MNEAYKAGKFERFGISNYSAQQVEELVSICEKNGWVKPSVYQVSPTNLSTVYAPSLTSFHPPGPVQRYFSGQ